MNTKEFVMKKSESGYFVPPKYMIMEVNVGSSLANTNIWLMCVSYGFETKGDYDAYLASLRALPTKEHFVGTPNAYEITNLDTVEHYNSNNSINREGPWPLG